MVKNMNVRNSVKHIAAFAMLILIRNIAEICLEKMKNKIGCKKGADFSNGESAPLENLQLYLKNTGFLFGKIPIVVQI